MFFGYLDPGTGSMLLQLLLGGLAGVAVSIKLFGRRIFSALAFWRRDDDPAQEPGESTPATERERGAA